MKKEQQEERRKAQNLKPAKKWKPVSAILKNIKSRKKFPENLCYCGFNQLAVRIRPAV